MIFHDVDAAAGLALHAEFDRHVSRGATPADALAAMLDRATLDLTPGSEARWASVLEAIRQCADASAR